MRARRDGAAGPEPHRPSRRRVWPRRDAALLSGLAFCTRSRPPAPLQFVSLARSLLFNDGVALCLGGLRESEQPTREGGLRSLPPSFS